jgi:hypothetical protein
MLFLMPRLPLDADDFEPALAYLEARQRQALMDGWKAVPGAERLVHEGTEWGVRTFAISPTTGERHQQIYVYASQRRRDVFAAHLLRTRATPVVTTPDADLERYLDKHNCRYDVVGRFVEVYEYRVIAEQYGDKRAARSGVYYMDHIDEGLAVLVGLGASERARRAFCLHPLVQDDAALARYFTYADQLTADPHVLTLALEYRHIAQSTRSTRTPVLATAAEIPLGPLADVHDMLRADKLQSYKDFIRHHRASHPRAAAIDRYYRLWLERLGIDDATRERCFGLMDPFAPIEERPAMTRAS